MIIIAMNIRYDNSNDNNTIHLSKEIINLSRFLKNLHNDIIDFDDVFTLDLPEIPIGNNKTLLLKKPIFTNYVEFCQLCIDYKLCNNDGTTINDPNINRSIKNYMINLNKETQTKIDNLNNNNSSGNYYNGQNSGNDTDVNNNIDEEEHNKQIQLLYDELDKNITILKNEYLITVNNKKIDINWQSKYLDSFINQIDYYTLLNSLNLSNFLDFEYMIDVYTYYLAKIFKNIKYDNPIFSN